MNPPFGWLVPLAAGPQPPLLPTARPRCRPAKLAVAMPSAFVARCRWNRDICMLRPLMANG